MALTSAPTARRNKEKPRQKSTVETDILTYE
jgi:hypothetical protein